MANARPPFPSTPEATVVEVAKRLEQVATRLHLRYFEVFNLLLDGIVALADFDVAKARELNTNTMSASLPLGEALGMLVLEAERSYFDVLGPVYMRLAQNEPRLGQFFTPWPIALVMARMNVEADLPETRPISILDPACGSGVMLLAACEVFSGMGLDPKLDLALYGVDIDPVCAKMTRANLWLHGIRYAQVAKANSLITADPFARTTDKATSAAPLLATMPGTSTTQVLPPISWVEGEKSSAAGSRKGGRKGEGVEQLVLFAGGDM